MTSGELAHVDLTDDERRLLLAGLMEYGGPAAGAAALAPLVGADSVDAFFHLTDQLSAAIKDNQPLSDLDWARALVLTEICWASDLLGAASEFGTNLPDERALPALRSLQRKLVTGERIRALLNVGHVRD
ncbi:hypothetical protein HZU40_13990 [Mycolicibacterium fluoranthenivorans]|uniref:Uncharacterized protein n=1 Tax=Mycolicibacterium fluoranthenivorans TaxID=258505 RepID=A0A7G8PLM8_9MYCO|nr:hypothetical protein [Mycolicibacterium fluoranthenivorans]QNJ95244.1 hypothetical protein HZU40_13990 [Mycolicibacterium fluoranthenivorans]